MSAIPVDTKTAKSTSHTATSPNSNALATSAVAGASAPILSLFLDQKNRADSQSLVQNSLGASTFGTALMAPNGTAASISASTPAVSSDANTKIEKAMQECYGICVYRRDFNQRLIKWVQDPNTTLSELNTYWLVKHANKAIDDRKKLQDSIIAELQSRIKFYSKFIESIEAGITQTEIDNLFSVIEHLIRMARKQNAQNTAARVSKNKKKFKNIQPKNQKYQVEDYFYKRIYDLLHPIISPETQELLQYISFDPLVIKIDELTAKLFRAPLTKLGEFMAGIKSEDRGLNANQMLGKKFFSHVSLIFKLYAPKIIEFTDMKTKSFKSCSALGEKDSNLSITTIVEMIREMKKINAQIKSFDLGIKTHYQKAKALKDLLVELGSGNAIENYKNEIHSALSELGSLGSLLREMGLELASQIKTTIMEKVSSWAKTAAFIIASIHEVTSSLNHELSIETIQNLTDTLELNKKLMSETVTAMQAYVKEMREYCHQSLQPPIEANTTKEIATATAATPLVNTAAAADPVNVSSKKPKRQAPKLPTVLNCSTAEEWNNLVAQRRQALSAERLAARRAKVEAELKAAAERKAAFEKRYTLSPVDLKAREEKVQASLRQNPTIKELFAKLYSTDFNFGHTELQALIHALQNQGFNIQAPYRDSHYCVVIEGRYGFMDEAEFTEKAGAVKAHNSDRDTFMKETIEDLQKLFTRAGFTSATVGLTDSNSATSAAACSVASTATAASKASPKGKMV